MLVFPDSLRNLRIRAGLTQSEAAALVHRSLRNWQQWEYGERRIDRAAWELIRLRLAGSIELAKSPGEGAPG